MTAVCRFVDGSSRPLDFSMMKQKDENAKTGGEGRKAIRTEDRKKQKSKGMMEDEKKKDAADSDSDHEVKEEDREEEQMRKAERHAALIAFHKSAINATALELRDIEIQIKNLNIGTCMC